MTCAGPRRPSGALLLDWRFCAVFCEQDLASEDHFASEDLECSRTQAPDPSL